MAMHYWNGSAWAIVNNSDELFMDAGAFFKVWNGSAWIQATNAKVWNGSTWKGFVDQVQISDDGANSVTFGGGTEASWAIYSSGLVQYNDSGGISGYPWIVNSANSNQYQIYVDLQSGGPLENTSDALNTWLDLSTTRVWRVFANEFDSSVFAILNAEIRHKITLQTVATNQFSLYATTTGNPVPQ